MWSLDRIVKTLHSMMPFVKAAIYGSGFIPTEEKDSLYTKYEELYSDLNDVLARSRGARPLTPDQKKQSGRFDPNPRREHGVIKEQTSALIWSGRLQDLL